MIKNLYPNKPLSFKSKDKQCRKFRHSHEKTTSDCNIIPFPSKPRKNRAISLANKVVEAIDSPYITRALGSSQLIKTDEEHHGIPIYRLNYSGSISVEFPSKTEVGYSNLSIIKLDEKIYFNLNQLIVASGVHHCFRKLNIHGVRKIIPSCERLRFDLDIKLIKNNELKSAAFDCKDRDVSYKVMHKIYCKVRTKRSPYKMSFSSYNRESLLQEQKNVIFHNHSCDYVKSEGYKDCDCDAHRCSCPKVKEYFKKLSPPKYSYWLPVDLLEDIAINVIKYAHTREYQQVTDKILLNGVAKINGYDIRSIHEFEELNIKTQSLLGSNLKNIKEAKSILYELAYRNISG